MAGPSSWTRGSCAPTASRTRVLQRGDDTRFCFELRLRRDMERPVMGFAVRGSDGAVVMTETDRWRRRTREPLAAGTDAGVHALPSPRGWLRAPTASRRSTRRPASRVSSRAPRRPSRSTSRRRRPATAARQRRPARRARRAAGPVRRFTDLALAMARADFKLRYLDSAIGYAWALGQPLLMYAVLLPGLDARPPPRRRRALPAQAAARDRPVPVTSRRRPALMLGSLLSKGTMLRKIPFPPLVVPLSRPDHDVVRLRAEPADRLRVHPRQRHHAGARLARDGAAARPAGRVHRRRRAASSRSPT